MLITGINDRFVDLNNNYLIRKVIIGLNNTEFVYKGLKNMEKLVFLRGENVIVVISMAFLLEK